jgi:hypothetical protein
MPKHALLACGRAVNLSGVANSNSLPSCPGHVQVARWHNRIVPPFTCSAAVCSQHHHLHPSPQAAGTRTAGRSSPFQSQRPALGMLSGRRAASMLLPMASCHAGCGGAHLAVECLLACGSGKQLVQVSGGV